MVQGMLDDLFFDGGFTFESDHVLVLPGTL